MKERAISVFIVLVGISVLLFTLKFLGVTIKVMGEL